jgi:tetratricopeptide (TPR) repeat protein
VTDEGSRGPRGATGADADHLRATVRSRPRTGEQSTTHAVTPAAPAVGTTVASPEAVADVQRWIEAGRAAIDSDPKAAHVLFEKAHRRNTNDARAMSNYGLTLVLVEGDRQRGIRFCEEGVRRGPVTSEMLTNLAKALVVTRNKEQAYKALKRAQDLSPDDPRVTAAFVDLGLRRRPPIPWLPRNFFLNKWIGKVTWKYSDGGRRRFEQEEQPPGEGP